MPFSWLAVAFTILGIAALVTGKWIGALALIGAATCLGLHFATEVGSTNMARKADEVGQ